MTNKKKIINDPLYGFIQLNHEILFDLMEHRYFQRLRRIKQLGMTSLVYPGALHTRFHHALGACYLMQKALASLKSKGVDISEEEEVAASIGILLHDIGHGPYSHTLEHSIVKNISHERISLAFMQKMNQEMGGKLDLAIDIFKGTYPKKFLCQLISGQLDTDRLDYLNRDSFFTGVAEGVVGVDRILHMLDVRNNDLVVSEKGVYSIEKFIIARRLMYWQVYLHKTVVASDNLLISILKRAKELITKGEEVLAYKGAFYYFMKNDVSGATLIEDEHLLELFSTLDDHDIMSGIKEWANSKDAILSRLSKNFLERKFPKLKIYDNPISEKERILEEEKTRSHFGLNSSEVGYYLQYGVLENSAYKSDVESIRILKKDNSLIDLVRATDNESLSQFTKTVVKHYTCSYL